MEEKKFEFIKGDRTLWWLVLIISVLSIPVVYSASTQLQYNTPNGGSIVSTITKHIGIMFVGFWIMHLVNFIKYKYLGGLSLIFLVGAFIGLGYASVKGNMIDGASASRWIVLGPVSVQPSTFVYLGLVVYLCRYLTKSISQERTVWDNILKVLLPISLIVGLVAKDNGSTAAIILAVSMMVLILGKFSWKYIVGYLGLVAIILSIVVSLAKTTSLLDNSRVHTWISRVETYAKGDKVEDKDKILQKSRATAAIVNGGIKGVGPGKGVLKNQLSQSVSDFVFAVIVEEYGIFGSGLFLLLYTMMLSRIIIIAGKIANVFGVLLVISIAVMLTVQIFVHIAVSLGLFPVTGQPLPLISAGGTSMIATYIQLGLVLNISSQIQLRDEEGIGKKQTIEEINDIA